ncbi:MAG: 3-isopropylmalate dehydrogenase [Flavobacteriaceae bacterium]|nr:3-isopropylmalate dehydrogenase [Flavobacteriaceae bacterium]
MKLTIALLPGDGIGPEITKQSKKVLEAIAHQYNHTFLFREELIGAAAIEKTGIPLPQKTIDTCLDSDAILFGAIGTPAYDDNPDAKIRPEQGLLQLRKALGLYSSLRPVKVYNQLLEKSSLKKEVIKGVDFLIYRELSSGVYYGERQISDDGTFASDTCSYHTDEIERIAHLAFKAAQKRKKKLTLVDKANVMESSRLWRKVVKNMGKQYPDVALDFLFIDNAAMELITHPKRFDVILTDNLFGDILSNEASVIGSSIGLSASVSTGDKYALFSPVHGSYSHAKGKSIANPLASILSAALLLDHFGMQEEAIAVRKAVEKSLELQVTTADIYKSANFSTAKVGDFIADVISYPDDDDINFTNIHIGQSTII